MNTGPFKLLFGVVLIMACCGCGGSSQVTPSSNLPEQKKTDRFNEAIATQAISAQADLAEDYLIGADDLLEIEAYNVEELKKTVRVNSQGEIGLPLVGIINVKGHTTSEVEKMIAGKLDKYVQETLVTVFVKEYKSQRISVVGAVNKPQIFAVTGQRYLLDMLMMAEGIATDAGDVCYIIRPLTKTGPSAHTETMVINLDELLISGNLSLNVPVFAGDVINVPKGGVIFVDGAVEVPGAYPMKGKLSLVQAITMAKGASGVARLDDVRIFRENRKGEKDIITADYEAILKGEKPDIMVAENDIIIVPVSGIKNFFGGFVRAMRGGLSFGSGSVGF